MRLKAGVLVAAAALAGCDKEAAGEKLKVGALLSTTGDLAGVGTSQLEGMGLAVEQINAAGGVLGRQLEVVHRDDATDEARATAGAKELADLGVSVVIGPPGSDLALASFGSLKGKSIVQIATSATSPSLSTLEDDGFFFRTCPSDASQGELVAKRARDKNFDRVAVLHMPGVYGEGLAHAFATAFEAAGGTVTQNAEYTEGQASYVTELETLFATNPQAVLLVAYPVDGARIIEDYLSGHSGRNAFWFLSDGVADNTFVTAVGASDFTFPHEGLVAGTPTGATADAFLSAYQSRFGTKPSPGDYTANTYDAVYLAALAMAAGNAESGVVVRDNLTNVSAQGTAYTAAQFADALAAIQRGEDVDYVGASGPVDLDTFGDAPGPYDIWKVQNGQLSTAEQGVAP